ncbi:MAG TPA: hypothetical protein PKM51_09710, partial [Chitinophagales bacterium]|nr:hypothetical protein [Chitinophagales bacterium]
PAPYFYSSKIKSNIGLIFFGTTTPAAEEAMDILAEQGISVDAMRLKAFPFNKAVEQFIETHDIVFVIEQNRDAQMRTLLMNELDSNPKKLKKILNYDGKPITADFIVNNILPQLPKPYLSNLK